MPYQILVPSGPGSFNDFVGMYPDDSVYFTKIDDGESHDGDSTYIYHDDPDYMGSAEFVFANPTRLGTVLSVELHCVGKRVSAPYGHSCELILIVDGSSYSDGAYSLTTAYTDHSQNFTLNPKTGMAWSWDDIDSLKAKLDADITTSGTLRFTSLYLKINHTSPSGGQVRIIGMAM